MSSLLGGGVDNSAQEKRLAVQEAALKKKEAAQTKELAARRKVAGRGASSKTLFNQVLGTDVALGKQKLGG